MRIRITTTFWFPLVQDTFFVALDERKKAYTGHYTSGEWSFELYENGILVLASRRIKLSRKETLLGHQRYRIIWQDQEIALLHKSWFRKELIVGQRRYLLPGLLHRDVPGLALTFPLKSLLWRWSVTSYCQATEPETLMLAIAATIFVWFTWGAVPAD